MALYIKKYKQEFFTHNVECEDCGNTFEQINRRRKSPKRFCDRCLRKRLYERFKKYRKKKGIKNE